MTKTFIFILILFLTLTSCNDNSTNSMTKNGRQKLVDSLTQTYKEFGDTAARQHAEQFIEEFEKIQKEHGDSVTYFDGMNIGFNRLAVDSIELNKINKQSEK